MAHKKGAGSSDNGRDSISKRLGVKLFGGQVAVAGNIIVRQRGTRFHPGENVYMGKDHTLHAGVDGLVRFKKGYKNRNFVFIEPIDEVLAKKDGTPVAKKAKSSAPVAPKAPAAKATTTEKTAATPKATTETVKVAEATVKAEAVVTKTVETVKEAPVAKVTETIVTKTVKVVKEAAAAETEVASSTTSTTTTTVTSSSASAPKSESGSDAPDDLKKVEGIGPKLEGVLNDAGIHSWAQLSRTSVDRLTEILAAAGGRYSMHNPGTWPYQAKLASEGNWEELKDYQDILDGGVAPE